MEFRVHCFTKLTLAAQVNQIPSIKGSFIPIEGYTQAIKILKGKQSAKKPNYDIIGIERVVTPDPNHKIKYRRNYIKTSKPVETFMSECSSIARNNDKPIYARSSLVHMHWGLIPVQYTEAGVVKRKAFHILRVVPQPGFHLMHLIQRRFFEQQKDAKPKDASMINDVCHYLQRVVDHEADINYGLLDVWNSRLPNPWTVTDPRNPTSVQRLLSPFTVLKRLLHHIPGGHCGPARQDYVAVDQTSLVIDGFPNLQTMESAQAAHDMYAHRQELYLKGLHYFEFDFAMHVGECSRDPDKEIRMAPLLAVGSKPMNLLPTKVNMIFTLQNFMKFSKDKLYADADRLTIPRLGVAMLDLFIFFDTNSSFREMMNASLFIEAHVGEHMARDQVTETKISMKYRVTDVQSLEDFPKAGLYKSARDGYKRNAARLRLEDTSGDYKVKQNAATLYDNYLRLQYTTTTNGLLMDSWMSDRVYKSACILEQLVGDLNPCTVVREALDWIYPPGSSSVMNSFVYDQASYAWARLNMALCKLNETVKANPLNLAIIWGMLKSDVLTFFGLHNQSWRWMMYCMQVAPMFGHLRTQTEDGHAARGECIMTAKPNSVGLNEVIIKAVNYCLETLLGFVVALTDEDRRVLRLDKVDRKTRAGMEASQAVELANDRVISKPTSSKLMQAVAVDEALRSFDENGLAGLINTGLPRDSNAGEGTTTKQLRPERGYTEKGETRQLPGMGWYVLCFATNTNARNPTIAEMLRTLACGAMITFAPGAPQSPGLATALTVSAAAGV